MAYIRPRMATPLTKPEKLELLSDYVASYHDLAASDPSTLNVKIERKVFDELLDEIGTLLVERSKQLASSPGPVLDFLQDHHPPGRLADLLPDEFRVFCLALNALKQWVSAEQAATDRYLLGGTARNTLRDIAQVCTITGQPLQRNEVELHHPVRDGRPPLPVSKTAHAALEGQSAWEQDEPDDASSPEQLLRRLKRSRTWSWMMLRRGCLELLGQEANHTTPAVRGTSLTFARRAVVETGKDPTWIINFLDRSGY